MTTITPIVVGRCRSPRRLLDASAGMEGWLDLVTLPGLAVLVTHSRHGPVLFDTGWSASMATRIPWLPHAVYRALVGYHVPVEQDLAAGLAAAGVAPAEVRHVIVSHFHADHVAGLDLFPHATVHASAAAWNHVQSVDGLRAWRHGFFPELLPADLGSRIHLTSRFDGREIGTLGGSVDLFGDGSIELVDLPGHAPGQMGAVVHTGRGTTLLVADAVFTTSQLAPGRRTSRLVERGIAHDPAAARSTIERLRTTTNGDPSLTIVPSHDPAFAGTAHDGAAEPRWRQSVEVTR